MLVVAATLGSLTALVLAFLSAGGFLSLPWILTSAAILGSVAAIERPVGQSFLPELVSRDLVQNAVALVSMGSATARMFGPALAGIVYSVGDAFCFFVGALAYGLAALLLLSVRKSELVARPRVSREDSRLALAFAYVSSNAKLKRLLWVNAIIGLLALNFLLTIDSVVYLTLGGSAASVGLAHALNAVGAVIGGFVLTIVPQSTRAVQWACLSLGVTLGLLAAVTSLPVFLALSPLFGVALAAYVIVINATVHAETPFALVGRVMSLVMLGQIGTTPFGAILVGWIMELFGPRSGLLVGSLTAGLSGIYLAFYGFSSSKG